CLSPLAAQRTPWRSVPAQARTDRQGGCAVCVLAALFAATATRAWGASTDVKSFDVAAQPLPVALVDFALQAGITIGGVRACQGGAQPLKGRFTLAEGLGRLLAGSGCRAEWIDLETARIIAVVPQPSRTAPPPGPAAPPPAP